MRQYYIFIFSSHIILQIAEVSMSRVDRGSSVGTAAGYDLDGPGSNPGGGEIFRTRPDWPWGSPSLL